MTAGEPQPSKTLLPYIWMIGGMLLVFRGWTQGWKWVIVAGIASFAVGCGLLYVQRSGRFREWEPRINLVLFIVVVIAFLTVLAMDLAR